MTLAELADLMRELGARDALNLDGGGSTTLVLGGRVVNRPTDGAGERPVTNALLVLGPAPGTCGVPG
jgi:exopolysaccharide biosynthesis protein